MDPVIALAWVGGLAVVALAVVQTYRAAKWHRRAVDVDAAHAAAMAALGRVTVEARRWRDVAQEILPNVVKLRRRA